MTQVMTHLLYEYPY